MFFRNAGRYGVVVLLSWWLVVGVGATRGSPWEIVLPTAKTKPTSGLVLKIDTDWVQGGGYRMVRVFVGPLVGPARATRTVRVRLTPSGYPPYGGTSVTQTIELPQGSRGVTARIAMPQFRGVWSMGVEVTESGRVLRDLSEDGNSLANTGPFWGGSTGVGPAILIIDPDMPGQAERDRLSRSPGRLGTTISNKTHKLPDVRFLVAEINRGQNGTLPRLVGQRANDVETLGVLKLAPKLDMLPFEELPHWWIGYSSFDTIFVSWSDLRRLSIEATASWRAIRNWVATGGTLIIFGAGERFEHLGAIDQLLGPGEGRNGDARSKSWKRPDSTRRGASLKSPAMVNSRENPPTVIAPNRDGMGAEEQDGASTAPLAFRLRDFEMGKVMAIAATEPFPGTQVDWSWLFNTLGTDRWHWERRHGIKLQGINDDVWNHLIPGVGMPPVATFLVLISLFVVLVGPVNYFLLRRMGRLYLLLVTVPVAALLVTVGIFAYALLADGLRVKLRMRSCTLLDQRNQLSVSWSRHTYFASLIPSQGLIFPDDAAVYPILGKMNVHGVWGSSHELIWSEGEQQLARGYLDSRVPSQFLVVYPTRTSKRLDVDTQPDSGDVRQVTNHLATPIKYLVLRGRDDQLYVASGLADGATAAPKRAAVAAVESKLADLFSASRPRLPEGLDPRRMRRSIFSDGFFGWRRGGVATDSTRSILRRLLTRARKAPREMLPCSYVAIVQSSPDVPIGITGAEEIASFHVILGRW